MALAGPERAGPAELGEGDAALLSSSMAGWLLRRVVEALFTMFTASLLIWALLPLAPGDPALRELALRNINTPSPQQVEATRRELGLDRPLPARYLTWMEGVLHGDLGRSFDSSRPITDELGERLPATLRLALTGLAFTVLLGVLAALLAAAWAGTWVDALFRWMALALSTLPPFVVGLLALRLVVVDLHLGAVIGDGSFRQALLPGFCLALLPAAQLSRLLRAGLVRFQGTPAAFVARARGATKLRVLLVHALPNSATPFLTALGVTLAFLLTGTAVMEAVFSWPGVGQYLVLAITDRDLPVIQGFTVLATLAFLGTSLGADAISALIDPRLRRGKVT